MKKNGMFIVKPEPRQATHSERERFVAELIRACPTATASTCQRLIRLGRAWKNLYENPANFTLAYADRISSRVQKLAAQHGCQVLPITGEHTLAIVVNGTPIEIPTS